MQQQSAGKAVVTSYSYQVLFWCENGKNKYFPPSNLKAYLAPNRKTKKNMYAPSDN